jgi:pilus assembly protein Flp/PilA
MITVCWRFLCDENGATAIEYGLIAAGIAVAIIGAIGAFGDAIKTMLFEKIVAAVS